MITEILYGSGFVLRNWQPEDAPSLVRHANNRKVSVNMRDGFPYPYTLSDANTWIEMVSSNKKDLVYAMEVKGEACGGIGLHALQDVYRYNAEIGFWLSEKHWGKGITTEAVGLLVDYAFKNFTWTRIFAGVFSHNTGSMRVLEKNGFIRESIHRKAIKKEGLVLDEYIYALLKEDYLK